MNFMRNSICVRGVDFIPLHTPNREEIPMNIDRICLFYRVEKMKVLTHTSMGFYHSNNLGGFGMSNHPTNFIISDDPLILKRSYYGYIS